MTKTTSCGYQGREFGASYPDAVCIGGFLWDADSCDDGNMLTSGGDLACPLCNTALRLDQIREHIQTTVDPDTPQMAVWEHEIRKILSINEAETLAALAAMPRHVFRSYRRHGTKFLPDSSRTFPWEVPHLSAHQNLSIMMATRNPPGFDPEAP